ncbi:MAG TPA: glucosaminidase domain-containing protein [Acidimicrobiia bacterium]|nr:glucosaminidase domain-containing protein [Acidimicrobiia bacterium]
MPTSKWMFERSRGAPALLAAIALVGIAPTAAAAAPAPGSTSTSSSTSTTTTTIPSTTTTTVPLVIPPPPEPFGLPLDIGLELLAQKDQANQDLSRFGGALPGDRAAQTAAQQRFDVLQRRFVRLEKRMHETQHDLDVAHANLQEAAVDAYMDAGSGRLELAIAAIASASSAMEAGRSMHLIGSFGDQQNDLVHEYVALQKRLRRERDDLTTQRHQADADLAAAKLRVVADQRGVSHARVALVSSVVGIMEFQKAATSASSPILGPSMLSAQQLADWVRASGHVPRITVPIEKLAQFYITEGKNAGVRGDVAFAQSILETYWFTFPGGGQLAGHDNNFAGIGACDSCKHGFTFDTARIGVRAQMQALRIYVDPDLTETTLKQPLVMPKMLNLGFRGKVQTWWDLWGTWATGAFYGQRVYDIYERMVAFAGTDPPHAPLPRPPA